MGIKRGFAMNTSLMHGDILSEWNGSVNFNFMLPYEQSLTNVSKKAR
jgi:hypothetical protein